MSRHDHFSRPLLPATVRAVDDLVAAAQETGRVPSLVAAVVRDGAVAHLARAGQELDPDTQFRIGSITKTMTATLVMQLRDQDRLSLDDLLYRHLPGTPIGGVTLRQLLGHLSGLQREPDGQWWERAPGVPLDDLLAGLKPDKLGPSRGHHYSNLAYGLLGAVLQRLTGTDWATLVAQQVLAPLGMDRTTYHPVEPFTPGYVVHPWYGTAREEPRHDSAAMAPAGQLWSTPADLARWAGFLAGVGGTEPDGQVLAPATLAQMCVPVAISDPETWTSGHGLGLALWRHGERVYAGHAGSMPGYLAVVAVDRRSGTGVVAFANAYTLRGSGIAALGTRLLTEVLDREPPPRPAWRPAPEPPPEVAAFCGRWWWMGQEFELTWDGAGEGELVVTSLTGRPGPPWRFARETAERWRGTAGMNTGEVLTVHRQDDGAVTSLDVATLRLTRAPAPQE